jgi:hypothetical protein
MKTTKLFRAFIIFFPVTWLALAAVTTLLCTGIRDIIYLAFNWPNYWTISDEWFDVSTEFEKWLKYWQTGKS